MKKKTKYAQMMARHRMLVLIWLLQVAAEALAVLGIWRLDMLPQKYFLILCGAFALLALFTAILLLPVRTGRLQGGTGVFLSVLIFIVSCVASVTILDTQGTIEQIVGQVGSGASVTVYVRAEDRARDLQDAGDYRFGIVRDYETERIQEAVDAMEEELGKPLRLYEYDTIQSLVDALYAEEVGALVLNSAYVDIVEEVEGYGDFRGRIRQIHEVKISGWTSVLESLGNVGIQKGEGIVNTPFVVYLSGSDTRDKTLSTSRSDVNILLVVNPETKQVLLLNTPRDYYIPNPVSSVGTKDKLTHCGIYGIECSMQALSDLYDVDVNYYAQINFTGFETLIDAIDGITVHSDVSFVTNDKIQIAKGENHLNGKEALSFARERKHLSGGDNARGQNQMKVIKAVIDKMTSGTTIISNYADIMESLEGMFATSMSMADITKLVKMQLDDMAQWEIHSYAVTGFNGSEYTYSTPGTRVYVMYPDDAMVANAADLIDKIFAGEILTEADLAVE